METDDISLRVASFSSYLNPAKDNSYPIKKPPPLSIKFSKPSLDSSLTNFRSDSFSYVNTAGDNFAFEIPGPVVDPTSSFTFSHEIHEVGVFNADKYFNMKLDYNNKVPENLPIIKPKTPSFCSESTSQATLLPSTKHKKTIGRKIFTGFGCKGHCFDKKSISEHIDPKLVAANKNPLLKIQSLDESRPSIEVFGSGNRFKGDIATNMERKLSMLTWDAIPKSGKTLDLTPCSSTVICDDMASEASSDLFEIDNISGSTNFPSLTISEPTCMSPNSLYAPSEASIQWSVVTASAADYSVLSDCNDSVSVAGDLVSKNNKPMNRMSKAKINEGAQKGRAGGLLGCKSYKAVDVAEKKVVCQRSNIEKGKHELGIDLNGKSKKGER
ncbi:hypothetical protein CASFOL_038298 [Castilleja foliolosa]|uniref:Uncharacterized protein n=1 Tax=Castilleja foliolosa TaxID=1961234 RepID=A0ABD3BL34_9LAMI